MVIESLINPAKSSLNPAESPVGFKPTIFQFQCNALAHWATRPSSHNKILIVLSRHNQSDSRIK